MTRLSSTARPLTPNEALTLDYIETNPGHHKTRIAEGAGVARSPKSKGGRAASDTAIAGLARKGLVREAPLGRCVRVFPVMEPVAPVSAVSGRTRRLDMEAVAVGLLRLHGPLTWQDVARLGVMEPQHAFEALDQLASSGHVVRMGDRYRIGAADRIPAA